MDPKEKRKRRLYLIVGVILALAASIVFAIVLGLLSPDKEAPGGKVEEEYVFDPSAIPTYPELRDVMEKAVEEIYGKSYTELVEENIDERIKIPGTQITFEELDVSDDVDLMSMTVMAFQRNPYALAEDPGDSVRTMPNGDKIDLANLVQNYSDVKYYVDRDDPTKVSLEGYCNGEYFKEPIDLMPNYAKYY